MPPVFSIHVDPARDLVGITLAGFFTEAAISDFVAERGRMLQTLRCGPNQQVTLVDIRNMQIQSQDMVARFQAVLADPVYASRRLGFVVATSLARMQLMRAVGDRSAQVFTEAAEAEAWLLAGMPERRVA